MSLKKIIQNLLKEYIDPRSVPHEYQVYFSPIVTWYFIPHVFDRMKHDRNLSEVTMKELRDTTERATKKLIQIVSDKRNNFKPGPGFQFQIIDKSNEYLQLGCQIDYYDTLVRMDVNVKTVIKSGGFLRLKDFVAPTDPKQLVIEV